MENGRINQNTIEKLATLRIIQADVESIYAILRNVCDPIFSMIIVPYYALFVQSCQEYMKEINLQEPARTIIKNARNYLKKYSEGYGKTRKEIARVDEGQDHHFREQLKYSFLKDWGIHYNLGTYWTNDRKVIGNTQLIAAFLGIEDLSNMANRRIHRDMGFQVGVVVNAVRSALGETMPETETIRLKTKPSISLYADLNTNYMDRYTHTISDKNLAILFLNALCSLNFLRYILRPMFDDDNKWLLRIEYVTTYYCHRSLIRFRDYCTSNLVPQVDEELVDLLASGESLFCKKFRNCMMHYNLEDEHILKMENIEKTFYGLIESCFSGVNYSVYRKKLTDYEAALICYFERQFCFDMIKLKHL